MLDDNGAQLFFVVAAAHKTTECQTKACPFLDILLDLRRMNEMHMLHEAKTPTNGSFRPFHGSMRETVRGTFIVEDCAGS